jgi:hypothetical protein
MTVANFASCAKARGCVTQTPQLGERASRLTALILGLIATCSSAMITVLAGAERGGSRLEKSAWVAIGLTLLLSAHFMPSLARRRQMHIRIAAGLLWIFSLLATGYTHATFFVNAQRDAGLERSLQIPLSPIPSMNSVGRTPNEIASERAKVETELASAQLAKCAIDCRWLTLRRSSLSSKMASLNIEFAEARRREQIIDSQLAERRNVLAKREAAEADPVSIRLARLIHSDDDDVSFALAISLGLLVEIVASMSWVLACHGKLQHSSERPSEAEAAEYKEAEPSVHEMPQAAPAESSLTHVAAVRWHSTWPTAANSTNDVVEPAPKLSENTGKLARMTVDLQIDLSGTKPRQDDGLKAKVLPLNDEEMLEDLVRAISNGETRSTLNAIKRYTGFGDARAMALRSRLVVLHPEFFREPLVATTS